MLNTYKHIVNNIINLIFVVLLILKPYVMIKKLLFIFITVFAFSNVNSQTFISFSPGCGSNSFEFDVDPLSPINGKVAYRSLSTPSGDWTGNTPSGIPDPTGSSNLGVQWDGSQWVFFGNNNPSFIIFTNSYAGALVPDSGWVSDGSPCGAAIILTLYDMGGVLPIDKESLDNKISVYPNPSSDFISISNINDITQLKITNITGQTVISTVIDSNNNQIDIRNLSKGFYFVEIEGKKTIKLIKK